VHRLPFSLAFSFCQAAGCQPKSPVQICGTLLETLGQEAARVDVRFTPQATQLLRGNEMTRSAMALNRFAIVARYSSA
jgi:hypothetical protein